MARKRHIQIEQRLDEFEQYCKTYWDLLPETNMDLIPNGEVRITLSGTESFYPAFLYIRYRAVKYWLDNSRTFENLWAHFRPIYRASLYRQAKVKRKTQRRLEKKYQRGLRERSLHSSQS